MTRPLNTFCAFFGFLILICTPLSVISVLAQSADPVITDEDTQQDNQPPKHTRGKFRKLTQDDEILYEFKGLEGWELDKDGVVRITDEKAYKESYERREKKRKQEQLRSTNTDPNNSGTKQHHKFNLFSWETPCTIIFILILYWISSSILTLRDSFRKRKE